MDKIGKYNNADMIAFKSTIDTLINGDVVQLHHKDYVLVNSMGAVVLLKKVDLPLYYDSDKYDVYCNSIVDIIRCDTMDDTCGLINGLSINSCVNSGDKPINNKQVLIVAKLIIDMINNNI